jgi:hypothetical protein
MLTDILRLSDDELDRLSDALARGAIGPGSGTLEAQRVGLGTHAALVLGWLAGAIPEFGSTEGATAALRARSPAQGPGRSEAVD